MFLILIEDIMYVRHRLFRIYRILKRFCVSLTTPKGYRVHEFGGEKFVRLAETSWMGGRSLFLGSAYCIVGFFCLVAAIFFGVISRKTRAKRHERKKKIDEQLVHYKDSNNVQSSL